MAGPKVQESTGSGPVTKRQKTQSNGETSSASLVRQSKIFAPFRVSSNDAITYLRTADSMADCWSSVAYRRSLYYTSPRQEYLPNHNLRRPLSPNLRSQARTQPCLYNSTADTRGYHCDCGMEEGRICSLVKSQVENPGWRVGVSARKKDCRVGATTRRHTAHHKASSPGRMDCRMWQDRNRDLEDSYLGALHDPTGRLFQYALWLHLQHAYLLEQDIRGPSRWVC